MPVQRCQKDNKNGYKWGDEGFCYTYREDSPTSEEKAKAKAREQGRAIEAQKK